MPTDPAVFLVAFLNTVDVEDGTDVLDSESAWAAWAAGHGLDPGDVVAARAARDRLRALASSGPDPSSPLPAIPLVLALRPDGTPELAGSPGREGRPDAAGAALAAVAVLAAQGRLDRVKICPADDCRWAFYDRSRNHSRTWCSMAVCGNRAKSRAFRERS